MWIFAIVKQLKIKDWILKNIVDDIRVASSNWKTEFVITLDKLWHARNFGFLKESFKYLKIFNNMKSFFRGEE